MHTREIRDDTICNLRVEYGWKISAKFRRMVSIRGYSARGRSLNCVPTCKARIRNARLRINRIAIACVDVPPPFSTPPPLWFSMFPLNILAFSSLTLQRQFHSFEENFELRRKLVYFIPTKSQFQRVRTALKHQVSQDCNLYFFSIRLKKVNRLTIRAFER